MNWLKAIMLVTSLLPGAIQAVETVAGKGNGADKKAAVKELVHTAAIGAAGMRPGDVDLIGKSVQAADPVIDGIVAALNQFGIFKQTPK